MSHNIEKFSIHKCLDALCQIGVSKKTDEHIHMLREMSAYVYDDIAPITDERIIEVSDAIKYLARLRFCADGDERSGDVLSAFSIEKGEEKLPFDERTESTKLPFDAWAESKLPPIFAYFLDDDPKRTVTLKQLSNGTVTARVDMPDSIVRSCFVGAYSIDKWSAKKIVSILCFELFRELALSVRNFSPAPYVLNLFDHDIPEWEFNAKGTFVTDMITAAMDAIVSGRIVACLECGAPVYLSVTETGEVRKNARRYCTDTHKNHGSDAKKMMKNGCSVDEVKERYPNFLRATLEEWSREMGVR